MKLIIDLAEAEGLDDAVSKLLEWHESPERMLSPAGTWLIIGTSQKRIFGWRITGLAADST